MKKTILALATLLCCFSSAFAQYDARYSEEVPVKTYFISIYGGPIFSINENGAQYFKNDKAADLIDWTHGGIAVGKNFSNRYGGRLAVEFSKDHSAANSEQTAGHGFYPYTFSDGSLFADWIINGGNVSVPKDFNWRPYFGVGAAYSFGFSDAMHPWQKITPTNFCLAFRYGIILEYIFNEKLGIYLDGTHEWYSDNFNGLCPREQGNAMWKFNLGSHEGFPFDMKLCANFGIALHF